MVCLLPGSREVGVSMEHVFPVIDLHLTGIRIKELREQRGISVKQLQNFLGFEQPQAIYKWQRGECLPTFDNMYAIACYFNVKIDDILVGNRQDFFILPEKGNLDVNISIKQNKKEIFLCIFTLVFFMKQAYYERRMNINFL